MTFNMKFKPLSALKTVKHLWRASLTPIVGATLLLFIAWSPPQAQAAARIASVTGNWYSTATWGGSAVPGAADSVTINAGISVMVPTDYAAQCTTIAFTTGSGAAGIYLASATASLTASGAVTIQRNGSAANTIDVGAGTFSAASVALQGTSASSGTRLSQILISTGTATNGAKLRVRFFTVLNIMHFCGTCCGGKSPSWHGVGG